MRKFFKPSVFTAGFFFLGVSSAIAVSAGGAIEVTVVGTVDESGELGAGIWNRARIELLLPGSARTTGRFDLDVFQSGGISDFFIRSLYVRRRFERAHLTVGRQPVSWAFGSIFNPTDFNLGAEIGDVERLGKFNDAAEVYVPLAWNAGVSFIGALTPAANEPKWGGRVRWGLGGFDLSVNYVYEPESALPDRGEYYSRSGATFKGDLGPLGTYGAFGAVHTGSGAQGLSGLIGADYSFSFRGMHPVYLQAEYLSLAPEVTGDIIGASRAGWTRNTGLFAGNVSYGIDDFSSVGLVGVFFAEGDGIVLAPYCETDLGGLILTLRGGYLSGERVALFGQTVFEEEVAPVRGILQAVLSYPF